MVQTPTSENPLDSSPETEQRIRERAYHLWQEDGCPHGRDVEYWERASELDAMAQSAGSGLLPNPMTQHNGEIQPMHPVEEAFIQENLGEFPDRTADQGERVTAPMTKTKASQRRRTSA